MLPATRGGRASARVGMAAGAGASASESALGGGGVDALCCILCISEARDILSLTSSNVLLASGVAGDAASVTLEYFADAEDAVQFEDSFPKGQKSGNPALISPAGRDTRDPIFGPRLLGMPSNTEKYLELLRSCSGLALQHRAMS